MTIMLAFVFSSTSAPLFHEEGLKHIDVLEDLKMFDLATEAEANAFCHGVDESVGWEECAVNQVAHDSKVAQVAFGKEESRNLDYKDIEFDSVAERLAFERGVEAGEGWFDHAQVEDEHMANLVQALAAMEVDGKAYSADNLLPYIKSNDELELIAEELADAEDAKARADRQFPGMTDAQKKVVTYVLDNHLMTSEVYTTLGDMVRHAVFMLADELEGVELTELEYNEIYDNILSR
jgi:hypothetical protein